MRLLVALVLVAVATALPRKPTKDFPKKFDASLDGIKDTYGSYERAPDEDFVIPGENAFFEALLPPSSYDAYFEQQPQDAILPPEVGSTYTGVKAESEGGEALAPPPVDTYSEHAGSGHSDLAPPPVSTQASMDQESYLSYKGKGQYSFVAPPLSSYAETPTGKSGAEVLASLAAMVHSLPQPNSYDTYQPGTTHQGAADAPPLILRPPSAQETPAPRNSSYSEIGDIPVLTPEQIMAAQQAFIPTPASDLLPPTL